MEPIVQEMYDLRAAHANVCGYVCSQPKSTCHSLTLPLCSRITNLPLRWQRTLVSTHVPNTSIPDVITFANALMTPIFISPTSTPLTTSPTSLQNLSLRLLFSDCVRSSDFATSLRIFHSRRSYCAYLFLVSSLFLIHLILHFSSHFISFARSTFYATSTQITLYPYYFTGPQVEEEFWWLQPVSQFGDTVMWPLAYTCITLVFPPSVAL